MLRIPVLTAVVACTAALALAACSPAPWSRQATHASEPLRACVTGNSMPYSDTNADLPGIELEYGRAVADQLGRPYEPVWIPSFDQLISALNAGQCDAVMNGLYITDARKALVDFSNPTWGTRMEVLVKKGTPAASLAALTTPCIATLAGSVTVTELGAVGITPKLYGTDDEAMRAVASGECSAAVIDSASAGWAVKSPELSGLEIVPALTFPTTYYVGAAAQKGEDELVRQLNEAEAQVRASGELEAILARYGVPAYLP